MTHAKRSTQPQGWVLLFAGILAEQMWVQGHVEWGEHQGDCAEELNQDMQGGTGGILEGIANGIAHYTGFMRLTLLAENNPGLIIGVQDIALGIDAQEASLDILLGIVPGTAAVVQEERHYNAAHRANHQQARLGLRSQDHADQDRYHHSHYTRPDHRAQGATCADINTACIVGINAILWILTHNHGVISELLAY